MDYYKSGGIASLAKEVRKHGRGEDSVLMHVTPGELLGLQSLAVAHGGSLTINPTTGLPEAGFLKSILPTILGMALAPLTGGSSLLAAGLVGAGTAAVTGDIKQGLMAGLGAFGGANLAGGLSSIGSQAASAGSQAASAGAQAAETAASAAPAAATAVPGATSGMDALKALAPAETAQMSQVPGMGISGIESSIVQPATTPTAIDVGQGMTQTPAAPIVDKSTQAGLADRARIGYGNIGAGIGRLGDVQGWKDLSTAMGGAIPTAMALSPFALGAISEFGGGAGEGYGSDTGYIRPYALDITNTSGQVPYAPGSTQEQQQISYGFKPLPAYKATSSEFKKRLPKKMAVGGLAALAEGGDIGKKLAKRRLGGDPYYVFAHDRRDKSMDASLEQRFAAGGSFDDEPGEDQYARGGALPPRFLSGGGDGMSDSIKARIEGGQEARLSDSEFVIPADVVSHLGNGSSKAGAKKLYTMMDRVRKARTGKKSQAPEINAKKYMPA